jgi:hypothetical protein
MKDDASSTVDAMVQWRVGEKINRSRTLYELGSELLLLSNVVAEGKQAEAEQQSARGQLYTWIRDYLVCTTTTTITTRI